MSVITIIGAGMMGSAMTFPACDNGHTVRLVGTHLDAEIIKEASETGMHKTLKRMLPHGIAYYRFEDVKKALDGADVVIGGVSSFGVEWFMQNILPIIPVHVPLLSITKGMINTEQGDLRTYPALYASCEAGKRLMLNAVGGPCTSYELADRDPTEVCFCGDDIVVLRRLRDFFQTDYYHISLSTDVTGVECAVALKNAYALGVTLAVGLSEKKDGMMHYNSQAALFGQGVKEMRRLLNLYCGGDEALYLGAGDLYVTVFGGRTRLIGTLLGQGMSFDEAMAQLQGVTLESIVIAKRTAAAICTRAAEGSVALEAFPLLMHIDALLSGRETVNIPWRAFAEELG